MQIKLDKLELTKVSFQVEEFELKNKGFILDMDYVIFDNKIILGFSNIEGFFFYLIEKILFILIKAIWKLLHIIYLWLKKWKKHLNLKILLSDTLKN